MKAYKAIVRAFAFLIDSVLIYITTSLIVTFFNPYAHNSQNQSIFPVVYIMTLIAYISVCEFTLKTTLGNKLLNPKNK